MLHLDTLTHINPDATSIYDISSMAYDVDRLDPYDDSLIVHPMHDEDRLDPDGTSIIDIRGMAYDPYDDSLIVHPMHDEDRLDPDGTSIIDIRGMAYDVDCSDLDATSIYVREPSSCVVRATALHHQIRELRQDIAGLRAAVASGWEVGPELDYQERRLAALLSAEAGPNSPRNHKLDTRLTKHGL
jgi:hypothetical protein